MKCDICQINEADHQTPAGDYYCLSCEQKFMAIMDDKKMMIGFLAATGDEEKMVGFLTAFRGIKRID